MRWLLETRKRWVITIALWTCGVSLVAAAFTRNENWPLNIVFSLPLGALLGWIGWTSAYGRSASREARKAGGES